MTTKFGLAQPVRRVEDPRLLKGAGRYTDDIALPGMLHGIVVRSPHAAARAARTNLKPGSEMSGVPASETRAIASLPSLATRSSRSRSVLWS